MFGILSLREKVMSGISIALLIAVIAFSIYHAFLTTLLENKITVLLRENSVLASQKAALQEENLKLDKSLTAQNAKIKEWVEAQDSTMKIVLKLIDAANLNARETKAKYDKLLNAPRQSTDDCKDLSLKMDEYIAERKAES